MPYKKITVHTRLRAVLGDFELFFNEHLSEMHCGEATEFVNARIEGKDNFSEQNLWNEAHACNLKFAKKGTRERRRGSTSQKTGPKPEKVVSAPTAAPVKTMKPTVEDEKLGVAVEFKCSKCGDETVKAVSFADNSYCGYLIVDTRGRRCVACGKMSVLVGTYELEGKTFRKATVTAPDGIEGCYFVDEKGCYIDIDPKTGELKVEPETDKPPIVNEVEEAEEAEQINV